MIFFVLWSVREKRPVGVYPELEEAQEIGFQLASTFIDFSSNEEDGGLVPAFWAEEEDSIWVLDLNDRPIYRIFAL